MSRTYRKTKSKQGAPKWSQHNFNQFQLDLIGTLPLPKRKSNKYALVAEVVDVYGTDKKKIRKSVPLPKPEPNVYELVTETIKVYGSFSAPKDSNDPRWCTKGTPGAIAEYGWVRKEFTRLNGTKFGEIFYEPTGRFYVNSKDKLVERTRWKLVRTPTDWSDGWRERWLKEYQHQRVFDHVHKKARKNGNELFEKHQKRRELRLEGKNYLQHWEDEYHLNEHLLPYNWVLDEDDHYIDDFFFDDADDWHWYEHDRDYWDFESECWECGRAHKNCRCVPDYEDDYSDLIDDYDPWADDSYADRGSHYAFDKRNERTIEDSGKSLGEILQDIQNRKGEQ